MSAKQHEIVKDVVSFTGYDESGLFNVVSGADRRISVLPCGWAHYRTKNNQSEFLVIPEGLLYLVSDKLQIATNKFYRGTDYEQLLLVIEEAICKERINNNKLNNIYKFEQQFINQQKEFKCSDS